MWPKCPRCKSREVRITEIWIAHTIQWNYGDAYGAGTLEPGYPAKVRGQCRACDHAWTLRGVNQINPAWWPAAAQEV